MINRNYLVKKGKRKEKTKVKALFYLFIELESTNFIDYYFSIRMGGTNFFDWLALTFTLCLNEKKKEERKENKKREKKKNKK